MTRTTADLLCDALDFLGVEHDRRDDYSGRGMYGKTTVGLVVKDVMALAGGIARAAYVLGSDEECDAAADFWHEVGRFKTDDMGLDTIVY